MSSILLKFSWVPLMSSPPIIEKSALEVQALSMQWLDFQRTGAFVGWGKEKLATSTLGKITRAVVEKFNSTQKKEDAHFHRHKCTFDNALYKLKVYAKKNSVTPVLVRQLALQGVENLTKRKGNEILLFFCKSEPEREIVVLSSDQAWRVLRRCINYQYPIKIAECILDPSSIVEISRRCLVGSNLQEKLLHPSSGELYKTSSLYYLVESFQCSAKVHSSLMNTPPFSRQRQPVPPTVKITSGGLLRIMKRIALEDYPALFNLFYLYTHQETTYTSQGEIETSDPLFEFLHFIQPAQTAGNVLDASLVNAIWSAYEKLEPLPASIRHKYLNDFLSSESFEIQFKKKGHFVPLSEQPPTLHEIIEAIDEHTKIISVESLLKFLSEGQLRYRDARGHVIEAPLIKCLEADVRHEEKTYFKIRGMWYQLAADFNALLVDDFRTLLKQKLLGPHDAGQLPNSWKGNKPQDLLTENKVKRVLGTGNGIRKLMHVLDEVKMCYVDPSGKVNHKHLSGSILQVPLIAQNRQEIEEELECISDVPLSTRLTATFAEQADNIMVELCKERPIIEVVKKNKKQERRVLNPATYPVRKFLGSKEAAFAKFLETLCLDKAKEDEAAYNRSYLYDKMNNGKPFGPKEGYLVFDQVLPNNIESCDIARYTPKKVQLIHVKEDLGQHTRDVCSQILNAAKMVRASLSAHQPKDYLQMLWDASVGLEKREGWRGMVQTQMKALGWHNFLKIFTERKIVFVYAFLARKGVSLHSETVIPSSLSPSDLDDKAHFTALKQNGYLDTRDRLTGKFYETSQKTFQLEGFETSSLEIYKKLNRFKSVTDSTLAKLELIHLARELEALNFEFEICEISRPDSPPWESEQLDSAMFGNWEPDVSTEEDEASMDLVLEGPSGLQNIRNSCYMNASLQALYFLKPILELIEGLKTEPDGKEHPVISKLAGALKTRNKDSLTALRNVVFEYRGENILSGTKWAQHDAHEFLVFILDQINWFPMEIYTYFSYKLPGISRTGHKSLQSPANHISLSIVKDQSFQNMLTSYFQPETKVDYENPLEPTYADKKYCIPKYSRSERITRLPPLLMIHIKRFDSQLTKIDLPIAFPKNRTVTIKQRPKDPVTSYRMIAIVNHQGKAMQFGHYTADVKDLQANEEQWYQCNDTRVNPGEPANPETEAYIVFLQKIE